MSLFPEIFRSVEWIWLLWGLSIPACLGLGYALRRCSSDRVKPASVWTEIQSEEGAAYAVPYVMTFPLYALFVGLVIECSLLLVTKVGTMYAAYAATRSAIVWESAKSNSGGGADQRMREKALRAATLAMVPFASGSSQHSGASGAGAELIPHVLTAAELFRNGRFVNPNYLVRKVRYAGAHTTLSDITRESSAPDSLLKGTVEFTAPFHIPGIGRILGQASGQGYYVLQIKSTASLPSESPQNESRDIGIQYMSD